MQSFEIFADALRKFLEQMEALKNFKALLRRGVVGQRGRRGDRGQVLERHVGEKQGKLFCFGRGLGEPAPLYGGKVFAHGVDFCDGCAGGNQRLVKGNRVIERDLRVKRQIEHRRPASADEEEDEGVLARVLEQPQRLTCSRQGILVGQRVATREVADAPRALPGDLGRGAYAAKRHFGRQAFQQGVEHGQAGLAKGDDHDPLVRIERNGDGLEQGRRLPNEGLAFEAKVPVKGLGDITRLESVIEDRSGIGMERVERSHWKAEVRKWASHQLRMASCTRSSLPAKKWSAPSIQTSSLGETAPATADSTCSVGPYWSRVPLTNSFGCSQPERKSYR